VGDVLTVEVWLLNGVDVSHVPFHLHFDPAVLAFRAAEEGSFLSGDGASTAFFASPVSTGGSLTVGLSRIGAVPGLTGGGLLCRLQFDVVGAGQASLDFSSAKVRNSSNRIVPSIYIPLALTAR